jgi:hypothetical protein
MKEVGSYHSADILILSPFSTFLNREDFDTDISDEEIFPYLVAKRFPDSEDEPASVLVGFIFPDWLDILLK